jgi:hypothetical protein
MSAPQKLGEITCPSGVLVVVDLGYMELWSGRNEPAPRLDEIADPEDKAKAASRGDYFLAGKDAAEVARLADYSGFGFFYDRSQQGIETIAAEIATLTRQHGLDAHVEREPRQISHRERAQRVADLGGGDFGMEGPWVGAVGTPPNQPLTVRGRRHDYRGNVGVRWAEVSIEVSQEPVESSHRAGDVAVDHGMILLGDADALGRWQHVEPLDGLYDVAFWGLVGEAVSGSLAAPPLHDGWGWRDIGSEEAKQRLQQVRSWLGPDGPTGRLVLELRPHSHFYRVMEQIRSGPPEVGGLTLDGAALLGLSTSWGDGLFPIWVDRDKAGAVVAIRLELGSEKRRQLMEAVWARAVADAQ